MQKKTRIALVFLVIAVAVILRVLMINQTIHRSPIRNDAQEYYGYAVNLKYFDTFSSHLPETASNPLSPPQADKNRPPGYPAFLYPLVKYPPDMSMVQDIKLAQAIIDTATVLVAFLLFRLFLPFSASLIGILLVAISPHLIAMNIYLLTETVFTFFLTLFLYVSVKGLIQERLFYLFLSGILLAITTLIKPSINYFIFFYIGYLIVALPKKEIIKTTTVIVFGFLLLVAPWAYRNTGIVTGGNNTSKALASLKNGSYPGLMVNNDIRTRGMPHRADPKYGNIKNFSDFALDLRKKITQNPVEYLSWYLIGKPVMFLSWDMVAGMGDVYVYPITYSPYYNRQIFMITHAMMKGAHPLINIAAIIMLVLFFIPGTRKYLSNDAKKALSFLAVIIVYFILLHTVVTPLPRYAIPLRPIMYGLAVFFFLFLFEIYKKKIKAKE